jgi:methyl-accepting chemotaxis protein
MVETVQGDAREIASASDNLSRRTEHQAATLEETAAALAEITAAVNSAAEAARNALGVVTEARGNAESSGRVVEEAVAAMGEISQSSRQISRIVSVIDDIAFQTNLLALNAGVEAARAGDAGRGFAVVASEVRALAQRSSEAAREIGGLISASGRHVEKGVDLVGEAGEALRRIATSVNGISDHVANIVHSAQEQSASLNEVNGSMTQLDQVTQQNAAMFEETSAASQSLMSQAEALAAQMARFKVGDATPREGRPKATSGPPRDHLLPLPRRRSRRQGRAEGTEGH